MTITTYKIGRENADIVLEDGTVSRLHAELVVSTDGRYYITDCGGKSGTYVQRNNEWHEIKQDFVQANEVLNFGSLQYTPAVLVTMIKTGLASSVGQRDGKGDSETTIGSDLPEGKVSRDPVTGDIIGSDD